MKKWFMILLCLVLLLSGCAAKPEAPAQASTQPPQTQPPVTEEPTTQPPETTEPPVEETTEPEDPGEREKYESDRYPYPYYVILYRGDDDYRWLGEEAPAQLADAEVGCLYFWNKTTKKITKFSDDKVLCYKGSSLSLFYGTEDGRLVLTDYKGENSAVIYQAKYGEIHCLSYSTKTKNLHFMDGNCVVMINKYDRIPVEVAFSRPETAEKISVVNSKSHGKIVFIRYAWDDLIAIIVETGEIIEDVDDMEADKLINE